jgi:hypothetical protein
LWAFEGEVIVIRLFAIDYWAVFINNRGTFDQQQEPWLSESEDSLWSYQNIFQGAPGVSAPRPLPLSALTKHKAWVEAENPSY